MDVITSFFRGDYMPHGHCYLWNPGILWTNFISDVLIALAYSHDLQEPLRKISAFAGSLEETLRDKLEDPDAKF